MTTTINYNAKLLLVQNENELKNILDDINKNILDNVEINFGKSFIEQAVANINDNKKAVFISSFISILDEDMTTAYKSLALTPNYDKLVLIENDNGTFGTKYVKALFKFSDIEKAYQIHHSKETDKNGKPMLNKSVTVFGALRFYGLCSCFVRNLLTENLTIDSTKAYDLSRVVISDENIFGEKDGECFTSTSNNALEKQLNILVKFFGLDVKMLKKDLIPLKLSAQKVKRNRDNNHTSIHEIDVLKFADILFSVITTRMKNLDVKVFTADGEEVTEENTTK